jgi:hypothetical protein
MIQSINESIKKTTKQPNKQLRIPSINQSIHPSVILFFFIHIICSSHLALPLKALTKFTNLVAESSAATAAAATSAGVIGGGPSLAATAPPSSSRTANPSLSPVSSPC